MAFFGHEEPYLDYRLRRYAAMATVLMEDRCEKKKIPIKITRIDMSGSVFYAFEFKYLNRRRGITPDMIKKILDEKKDVYVNGNKILITK